MDEIRSALTEVQREYPMPLAVGVARRMLGRRLLAEMQFPGLDPAAAALLPRAHDAISLAGVYRRKEAYWSFPQPFASQVLSAVQTWRDIFAYVSEHYDALPDSHEKRTSPRELLDELRADADGVLNSAQSELTRTGRLILYTGHFESMHRAACLFFPTVLGDGRGTEVMETMRGLGIVLGAVQSEAFKILQATCGTVAGRA